MKKITAIRFYRVPARESNQIAFEEVPVNALWYNDIASYSPPVRLSFLVSAAFAKLEKENVLTLEDVKTIELVWSNEKS